MIRFIPITFDMLEALQSNQFDHFVISQPVKVGDNLLLNHKNTTVPKKVLAVEVITEVFTKATLEKDVRS